MRALRAFERIEKGTWGSHGHITSAAMTAQTAGPLVLLVDARAVVRRVETKPPSPRDATENLEPLLYITASATTVSASSGPPVCPVTILMTGRFAVAGTRPMSTPTIAAPPTAPV